MEKSQIPLSLLSLGRSSTALRPLPISRTGFRSAGTREHGEAGGRWDGAVSGATALCSGEPASQPALPKPAPRQSFPARRGREAGRERCSPTPAAAPGQLPLSSPAPGDVGCPSTSRASDADL